METVKRGYMPKDIVEFGPKAAAKLTAAAQELAFLRYFFEKDRKPGKRQNVKWAVVKRENGG